MAKNPMLRAESKDINETLLINFNLNSLVSAGACISILDVGLSHCSD